jgi:hypothetical protein
LAKGQQRSREKRKEHLGTEGHQGEGAGEKEETDWDEAEGNEIKQNVKKSTRIAKLPNCRKSAAKSLRQSGSKKLIDNFLPIPDTESLPLYPMV